MKSGTPWLVSKCPVRKNALAQSGICCEYQPMNVLIWRETFTEHGKWAALIFQRLFRRQSYHHLHVATVYLCPIQSAWYTILQAQRTPSAEGIYSKARLSRSLFLQTTYHLPLVYLPYKTLTWCEQIIESHWKKPLRILRVIMREGFQVRIHRFHKLFELYQHNYICLDQIRSNLITQTYQLCHRWVANSQPMPCSPWWVFHFYP